VKVSEHEGLAAHESCCKDGQTTAGHLVSAEEDGGTPWVAEEASHDQPPWRGLKQGTERGEVPAMD
jgi:hypothetical protein